MVNGKGRRFVKAAASEKRKFEDEKVSEAAPKKEIFVRFQKSELEDLIKKIPGSTDVFIDMPGMRGALTEKQEAYKKTKALELAKQKGTSQLKPETKGPEDPRIDKILALIADLSDKVQKQEKRGRSKSKSETDKKEDDE